MRIQISGQNISLGSALQEHVETVLTGAVNKYFDRAIEADVVFHKEAHLFKADIRVNEGTGNGMMIRAEGKADDVYPAFDAAAEKIEKQLRRYKRRLKDHHKTPLSELSLEAKKYVIPDHDAEDVTSESDEEVPLIIAEKQLAIETLTVSDAVMRMNLADLPAVMFVNKKTGDVNLVYRRHDGNISWVESEIKSGGAGAKAA